MSVKLGIWGCWQGNNLGDQWIKKTMGSIFPQAEFIEMERSLEGYDFLICGGGGLFIKSVPASWMRISRKTPFGMIGLGAEFEHTDYRALELYQRARFFYVRDEYSARCMKLENNLRSYDITFADPLSVAPCDDNCFSRCLFVWRTPDEWMLHDGDFEEYQDAHYDYCDWERAVYGHFSEVRYHDFSTYDSNVQEITEGCNFIVSGRYHGIIAAVQMGIPCIGIDLCPKIRALMREIGIEKYCLKLSEVEQLPHLIEEAKENWKRIREKELTYREKATETIAEQIEKVKYEISGADEPTKTDDRRIKKYWSIATVRKAAALLKEHPLYYTAKRIPLLNWMLPEYIREYGPDSKIQKLKRTQILKYCDISDQITLLCEDDNKAAKMLRELGYVNVVCRDFDKKRVEKKQHIDPSVPIQFCAELLNTCSAGKMIVCANILNSIPNEDRWALIKSYLQRFEICLFHGRYNLTDRAALGPEPIGSFGCKEYDMKDFNVEAFRRKYAVTYQIVDDSYLLTISRST